MWNNRKDNPPQPRESSSMFQYVGIVSTWICKHPLHCVITFICHISFQNTNNISKSQYSQPTFAPRRSSPPSHHHFSCVTGSHWRNWQRRGSTCTCLIPVLVPLSCLCPIAKEWDEICRDLNARSIFRDFSGEEWQANIMEGWIAGWVEEEDSCLSLG